MLKKSFAGSVFCLIVAVPLVLRAADDKAADAKKAKNAATDTNSDEKVKGRLPNNWGKLALTQAQKEKVYTIESSYAAKLEELQKAIADLQAKRDTEMHKVLTADQQKQLDTLTADATKARAAKKAAAADAKTSKSSDDSGKTAKGAAKNASASK